MYCHLIYACVGGEVFCVSNAKSNTRNQTQETLKINSAVPKLFWVLQVLDNLQCITVCEYFTCCLSNCLTIVFLYIYLLYSSFVQCATYAHLTCSLFVKTLSHQLLSGMELTFRNLISTWTLKISLLLIIFSNYLRPLLLFRY